MTKQEYVPHGACQGGTYQRDTFQGGTFVGTAYDAYGKKPEQIIKVTHYTSGPMAASCTTAVIIPTLYSNDPLTNRVIDLFNSTRKNPEPHILSFLKDHKKYHYAFDRAQYSCAYINVDYNRDYTPCGVSIGVTEARKGIGFSFCDRKSPYTNHEKIRNIRELGEKLIAREQIVKKRYSARGHKWTPDHDNATNNILMEHANKAATFYAQKVGLYVLHRVPNLGGSTSRYIIEPKYVRHSKTDPVLGLYVPIPPDTAATLFDQPQRDRQAEAKFTKPGHIDCAANLEMLQRYRQGAQEITLKQARLIASILSHTITP